MSNRIYTRVAALAAASGVQGGCQMIYHWAPLASTSTGIK